MSVDFLAHKAYAEWGPTVMTANSVGFGFVVEIDQAIEQD